MPEPSEGGRVLEEPKRAELLGRRVRIAKEDLLKFGHTQGCPGCVALNRGEPHKNHNEECMLRIEEELRRAGSKKMVEADRRLTEEVARRIEEEEKAKPQYLEEQ